MEDEILRSLIRQHLQREPGGDLIRLRRVVADQAMNKGYVKGEEDLGGDFERRVLDLVWELVRAGLVRPGSNFDIPNLPRLTVTDYGRRCLAADAFLPHDPTGFLAALRKRVPTLDPVVEIYVTEALEAFLNHHHLASVVMIGVASEQIVVLLLESMKKALGAKNGKFEKAIARKPIKHQYDEMRKRLEPNKLPKKLEENLTLHLDGIYDFIRRNRNDAGHPTGRTFERDEVAAILKLFPIYCDTGHQLVEWLNNNTL